jgi:hypothetical protein
MTDVAASNQRFTATNLFNVEDWVVVVSRTVLI